MALKADTVEKSRRYFDPLVKKLSAEFPEPIKSELDRGLHQLLILNHPHPNRTDNEALNDHWLTHPTWRQELAQEDDWIAGVNSFLPFLVHTIKTFLPDNLFIDPPGQRIIPLIEHVERPKDFLQQLVNQFVNAQYQYAADPRSFYDIEPQQAPPSSVKQAYGKVFKTTNSEIHENHLRAANRAAKDEAEGKVIPWKRPEHSREKPVDMVRIFFKNTFVSDLLLLPVPIPKAWVRSPQQETEFSGTWVIGGQGKGKTNLLRHLISQRLERNCSMVLFDSKGDLSDTYRSTHLDGWTVLTIDPAPTLALNPLDLGTHNVTTLMYVFSALLDAGFTALQSVALRQAIYLTTQIPNATFTTFIDIVTNGADKYPHILETLDPEEQHFWKHEYKQGTYKETRGQLLWRLSLLRPPGSITRSMFNAPKTLVDMQAIINTPKTLTIINNSRALLDPLQAEFFGRLFLTMILGAAEQRAGQQEKLPCYVVMDEAQTIIARETAFADVIYMCRSQRIGMTAAHQSLSQIENDKVLSALADCATKYASSDYDAPALAPRLRTTADHIQNLNVGQFALHSRDHGECATFDVPFIDVSKLPKLSPAQIKARDAQMRATFHYDQSGTPATAHPTAPTNPTAPATKPPGW